MNMKKLKRIVTMTLVLTLCLTALTGCGRRNNNDNNSTTVTPSARPTEQVTTENAMGIISYVGDSYIAISEYTTDMEIKDFADFDKADMTASGETRYISVTQNTEYRSSVGADTEEISKSDLAVGDFITAATKDGVLRITRLGTTGDQGSGDDREQNHSGTEPSPEASPNGGGSGNSSDNGGSGSSGQ